MAVPPSAVNLAAAIQAGVDPRQAQRLATRNQQFNAMMAEMLAHGHENIRSPLGLGVNLLTQYLLNSGKSKSDQAVAGVQRQIAAARYPNDPKAQLLYLTAPDDMNKAAVARDYSPIDVRQGNTVLNAPTPTGSYTAPVLHDDGGVYSTQTPTGVSITGTRPANYQEQTQQAAQGEAARHNVADEGIQNAKIPIELGMMNVALRNAQTNAGGLGLSQTNSANFAPPPGFVIGHPGAAP